MIKIQNNINAETGVSTFTPTREPIPAFLQGLAPESLADLSWTDSSLGVQDCKWWPEQDDSLPLGPYQTYGDETLTIGDGVVHITRTVIDLPVPVPQTLTARQAKRVLLAAGLLDSVNAAVAAADRETQIDWEYAVEMRRDWPTLQAMATAMNLTDQQLDDLFIAGAAT